MLKLNRGDQAKQCFMEALALDVKCFEAFDQLVTGEMMTPDEGTFSLIYLHSLAHKIHYYYRVGVRSRFVVLSTNTARRAICAADLYYPAEKTQARQGTRVDETEARGGIWVR